MRRGAAVGAGEFDRSQGELNRPMAGDLRPQARIHRMFNRLLAAARLMLSTEHAAAIR